VAECSSGGRQLCPSSWLIGVEHRHDIPRRETDVADSALIAHMVEHGLVRPGSVPPAPIRDLRDPTRHRRTLVDERTVVIQRLEKVLQDAGIKLTGVASALLPRSRRAILHTLSAGESDPAAMADLDASLAAAAEPFRPLLQRLTEFPGVSARTEVMQPAAAEASQARSQPNRGSPELWTLPLQGLRSIRTSYLWLGSSMVIGLLAVLLSEMKREYE